MGLKKKSLDKEVIEETAARLAIVRGENKLTQEAFAKSINVSARAYYHYERGHRGTPMEALVRVAELYNVDLNWLMRGLGRSDLNGLDAQVEQFATELYEYLTDGKIRLSTEHFKAIVSRWRAALLEGKSIPIDDVQIWVDLLRAN